MQSVPEFPAFRKFTLADRGWYDPFYREFEPYADFSFGNLIVWLDYHDDLMVSRYGDNLIFVATTLFMNDEKIYTFIGKNQQTEVVQAIFAYQRQLGEQELISGLTEVVAADLRSGNSFSLVEDRDNFEYLYGVEQWAGLEGSLMRKLRREVNTYRKQFGDVSAFRSIDLSDDNQVKQVQDSLIRWSDAFSENDREQDEAKILNRLFGLAGELPHKCLGLFVHDVLEAFLIYQPLPHQSTVIFNHVKASYRYRYMFDFLLHGGASQVSEEGVKYINFEQDLGIEGLREHKQSLKPFSFVNKYSVRPR